MKKRKWKGYAFEFLSIFIAVISAFALNNWNDNRRDRNAESKILAEIRNGLVKDMEDVKVNIFGHEYGTKACDYFERLITNEVANTDTIQAYYFNFLRDFISIQNTSGYENLKSRGLELIENDSLRASIISLYEYDYQALKLFEEEYFENQFHENYYQEINDVIAPHFEYNEANEISGVNLPIKISEPELKIIRSYFWRIRANRNFVLTFYRDLETKINKLMEMIDAELA